MQPSLDRPPTILGDVSPSAYDGVWKLWKLGSLALFAVFVVAFIDGARSLRRLAAR